MMKIMKQFEEEHKKLHNLQRNNNPHYMLNNNKSLFPFQSNEQKIIKRKIKNKRQRNKQINSTLTSLEVSKYNNQAQVLMVD